MQIMKLCSVGYLLKQGIRNIGNNNIMSFASFCIMTVSLIMIGFTLIFSMNINSFISDIEGKNEVIIFLSDDADDEYIESLGEKLSALDNVADVSFYSKEEAFNDVKKDMEDADDIFSYLGDESPLPDAYRIKIADISEMSSTLMTINSFEKIEKVKAPYDFVNVLTGLKTIVSIVSLIMLGALAIVSVIIISNTTHASVNMRKREIDIMKFVGATNFFVKVPFFVEGFIIGILSGVVAAVATYLCYNGIVELLSSETTLFMALGTGGFIPIETFFVYIAVGYLVVGALLSAIGTVSCTRKYVKV